MSTEIKTMVNLLTSYINRCTVHSNELRNVNKCNIHLLIDAACDLAMIGWGCSSSVQIQVVSIVLNNLRSPFVKEPERKQTVHSVNTKGPSEKSRPFLFALCKN